MFELSKKIKHDFEKNFFEKKSWESLKSVCGVDEVGRGCLSGPLVVAAVILPRNASCHLLKDSKVLTERERELAYEWIISNCCWSTAFASAQDVDRYNIYQSTLKTMYKVCTQLFEKKTGAVNVLNGVLVDAMPLDLRSISFKNRVGVYYFNYGETKSSSIAAASIVAKVTRDRFMKKLANYFPAFLLGTHKGYATKKHIDAIHSNGISLIHRKTFVKNFIQKDSDARQQQSITTVCGGC